MAYDFVQYRDNLREQLLDLQQHLWGPHRDLNSGYLDWKHRENPYLQGPLIYVALSGEKVVGMRGMMGSLWEGGDGLTPTVIPVAGDLVVHPEHRSASVVRRMMQFALDDLREQGFRFVLNMSGGRFTRLSSLRMGWRVIGDCLVTRWTNRSMRERTYLGAPRRFMEVKWARRNGHPFGVLDSRARRLETQAVSVGSAPQPARMAELVRSLPWDGRLRQRRDLRFFDWRYRNPRSSYRFFFHGSETLEGYLVLEAPRRQTRMEARLVDWEAVNDQIAEELIGAAVETAGLKYLTTWTATLPDSRVRLLEGMGFKTQKNTEGRAQSESPSVLVKSLQEGDHAGEWLVNGLRVDREASWDFRPVYSDAG